MTVSAFRVSISLLLLLVLVCVANGQDLPDPERAMVVRMTHNMSSGSEYLLQVEWIRDEPTKTYAWITVSRRVFQTACVGDIWLYDDRGWRPEPK